MGWTIFPVESGQLIKKEWFNELRAAILERDKAFGPSFWWLWTYSGWHFSILNLDPVEQGELLYRVYKLYRDCVVTLTKRYYKKYGSGDDTYWQLVVWEDVCQEVFGEPDLPDRGHWLTADHLNDLYRLLNYSDWIEVSGDHASGLTNYRTYDTGNPPPQDGITSASIRLSGSDAQSAATAKCTEEYDLSPGLVGSPVGSRDSLNKSYYYAGGPWYSAAHQYHETMGFNSPPALAGTGEFPPFTIDAKSEAYLRVHVYHEDKGATMSGNNVSQSVMINAIINGQSAGSLTVASGLYGSNLDVHNKEMDDSTDFVWKTMSINGEVLDNENSIFLSPLHPKSSYVSLSVSDGDKYATGYKTAYFDRWVRIYYQPNYEYQASK